MPNLTVKELAPIKQYVDFEALTTIATKYADHSTYCFTETNPPALPILRKLGIDPVPNMEDCTAYYQELYNQLAPTPKGLKTFI